jgi:HEXXH motif-containing protein
VASHAWRAHASGGLAPRYITVSGLRHVVEGFPWISDRPPSPPVDVSGVEERIARIHRGWAVILERAPRFGTWVASTAAGCLLLEPSGKHDAQSGSSYDHPGLIAFEPPDSAEFCGEILVHECAHQHMLAYTMVTPLVDPASQETYYSPIKRAHRTLDRVLSGAHAVGNMILYYDDLRQGGPLSQSSQKRFERHVRWFNDDYRLALDHSTSLTEAGRILWGSLCESVDLAVGR